MSVLLCEPTLADKPFITDLLPYYRRDLAPFLPHPPVASASDDAMWWEHPGVLSAWLICADDAPAGFALVASPPFASPNADYRLNEFYVRADCRRHGVGRRAAALLFARLPGRWELAHLPRNASAQAFWEATLTLLAAPSNEGACISDLRVVSVLIGDSETAPGFAFTSKGVKDV